MMRFLLIVPWFGLLALFGCGGGGGGSNNGESAPEPIPNVTLSGTIQAAAGNAVDSDVNDINAQSQPNNDPASAQPIPNPVTLGGYANRPGAGPSGASQAAGDIRDWYRVSLTAGQTVTLFIAEDGMLNDLDLGLFDTAGNLLNAAASQSRLESLTIDQPGDYLLLVEVFQGASTYGLSVGQAGLSTAAGMRLSDAFVPGEIVVRFEPELATSGLGVAARAQSVGLAARGGDEGRNMLLSLDGVQRAGVFQALGLSLNAATSALRSTDSELQTKLDTLRAVKALNLRADVRAAAPNYLRQALFVPNDELFPAQWHYPLINLPQAWDLTTGTGAIVAVLDTGVVLAHPDLQGQLIDGYDFISNPLNANDGDGIDPNPDDPGDNANPGGGGSFHGTHVAGTVAAATNNMLGVAGVAFGARVMPLRVLGRIGGSDFDIEQALRFAAGLSNDSGTVPPRRADVANLSLGNAASSAPFQAAIDEVRAAGLVVVAAAGNESTVEPFFPASYTGVISVSAVDITQTIAPYSNFGPFIDVAAPGGNTAQDINGDGRPDGVLSTLASGGAGMIETGFGILQGTSMAAPHMAGVVALMRSANPNLTPQALDNLLASGRITQDLGPAGRDAQFGHGLINAYQAVVEAINAGDGSPVDPIPILVVNPVALNFGTTLSSLTLTVTNGGGGALTVNSPSENSGGWLGITPAVDDNGLGSYTVTVNRAGLAEGIYTATVNIASNAGTVQIPIIMQVSNALTVNDVGVLYVLLFDRATEQTVTSVVATREGNGRYGYQFNEVPAGSYQIFAGTDADNDGLVCDDGEACGAYLTLDEPVNLIVDTDRDGLDFTSGFADNLPTVNAADAQIERNARYPDHLDGGLTR
ncbi:MAG: S8 family serine peptidase [Candidatus Competibacteraceae bacterium]|jgi:serine protease|nr:S8 family serine peptidase [Candidatus Competibacteraceae bacterium]